MEDLAELAAAVTDFAAGAALTLVPAVPQHDYGPEVCLGPDTLDLPGFLALAEKLGGGVLYLRAEPFDPASGDDQLVDAPAHLVRHKGKTGEVAVAFAANGIVHFWEHRAAWYLEWQDLTDRAAARGRDDDEDQGDRLSDGERAREAAELADTMLADPRFRAAQPGRRRQLAELAIPAGTDSGAGWDAVTLACARAEEMTQEQYGPDGPIRARLGELAAEFLASQEYRKVSSAAARREAAGPFLIQHAAGFWAPPVMREELYAQAQQLARAPKGGAELF